MYEILKALATAGSWVFNYGRSDFQNLFNELEQLNTSHIFLDPVEIEEINNDSGEVEEEVHSGAFMILYSSDIDETTYDFRYQNYIKPVLDGDLQTIKEAIKCTYEGTFDSWKKTEVINMFDNNFDGVLVSFKIRFNV